MAEQCRQEQLEEDISLADGLSDLSNCWLEWHVTKDAHDDRDLVSFDFKIKIKDFKSSDSCKVEIPILALYHLAEKYNWLQVLRNSEHRPQDPYELVRFIKTLESI